jgi:hypothetical protein
MGDFHPNKHPENNRLSECSIAGHAWDLSGAGCIMRPFAPGSRSRLGRTLLISSAGPASTPGIASLLGPAVARCRYDAAVAPHASSTKFCNPEAR